MFGWFDLNVTMQMSKENAERLFDLAFSPIPFGINQVAMLKDKPRIDVDVLNGGGGKEGA